MNESNSHVDTYRVEAEELLSEVEESILDIEQDPEDKETINRLFRAMHTIKGSEEMLEMKQQAWFSACPMKR